MSDYDTHPFVTVGELRDYLKTFPDKAIVLRTKADHKHPGSAVCLDIAMDHLEATPKGKSI